MCRPKDTCKSTVYISLIHRSFVDSVSFSFSFFKVIFFLLRSIVASHEWFCFIFFYSFSVWWCIFLGKKRYFFLLLLRAPVFAVVVIASLVVLVRLFLFDDTQHILVQWDDSLFISLFFIYICLFLALLHTQIWSAFEGYRALPIRFIDTSKGKSIENLNNE